MKFLVAPNAFKGTLSAGEAAKLISGIISESIPYAETLSQPVADGGDGTCELLIDSLNLGRVYCWSLNAVGQPILGFYGWKESTKTAFIDVSTCSGLGSLQTFQKDPRLASTYGTGLLIQKALNRGAKELVLGLGGSATVDMGTGILAALGFLFLDEKCREIPVFSPDLFKKCRHIQLPLAVPSLRVTCLCDVKNFFFGEKGAIPVFGPQKGLKKSDLIDFEKEAEDFFQLLLKKSKKPWKDLPGFGAAGGIAMGLSMFFTTQIEYGSAYFFDQVGMEKKVEEADWIITGEGRFDSQSIEGKACFELLQLARSKGKKIGIITSGDEAYSYDFDIVMNLPDLDFSSSSFKEKARKNFCELVKTTISKGGFY